MLLDLLRRKRETGDVPTDVDYHPGFTTHNRALWDGVESETRTYWILRGEKYQDFEWPDLTAEMYGDYERTGNRRRFELPYHTRRQIVSTLVLAEGFENRGRFLQPLVDGMKQICQEPTWVLPAHRESLTGKSAAGPEEHAVDIFAAETGNTLAWALHVLRDALTEADPEGLAFIREEIRRRIIDPYLERTDFWWLGYGDSRIGNWTTWCTSNCLGTVLLEERDARRRLDALDKACFSLSRFVEVQGEDGGCDEGPMYWNFAGACLFDSLEMLYESTNGALDVFGHRKIRNIATYIRKVHIHDLYFVNFADSPPRVPVDGALMYRFGSRIGDAKMQSLGAHLFRLLENYDPEKTIRLKMYRALAALGDDSVLRSVPDDVPHSDNDYLQKIQVLVARESGNSAEGMVLAVKGGHNHEGHNHNDIGNLVVYMDGQPVFVDVGMSEYSKDSFSERRYEKWALQSAYHNVPLVNEVAQANGRRFHAQDVRYTREATKVSLSMDLSRAYPDASGLELWERECVLDRKRGEIRIHESFRFRRDDNNFELRFMTATHPRLEGDRIVLDVGAQRALELSIEPGAARLDVHQIPLEDKQLLSAWGTTLYQIRMRFEAVPREGGCITLLRPAQRSGTEAA